MSLQLPHKLVYSTAQVVHGKQIYTTAGCTYSAAELGTILRVRGSGTAYLMGGVVQDDPSQEQLYSRDTYSLSFNTLIIRKAPD